MQVELCKCLSFLLFTPLDSSCQHLSAGSERRGTGCGEGGGQISDVDSVASIRLASNRSLRSFRSFPRSRFRSWCPELTGMLSLISSISTSLVNCGIVRTGVANAQNQQTLQAVGRIAVLPGER